MTTEKTHIEMDCIHNHVSNAMICSWLNGRIKLVVYWSSKTMVILKDGEMKDSMSIEGMGIDEFMRHQEHCQEAANQLSAFEEPAYAHV